MKRDEGNEIDERSPERKRDFQTMPDALPPDDLQESESLNAGQAGDAQDLSPVEDASEESVEELAASGQALEAAAVEGVEDAADHPERSVHTHEDYGRPDDLPPRKPEDEAA